MLTTRRLCILALMALVAAAGVMGDESEESSIEDSYLQEAIEMMIIRETSRAGSLEQKEIALEYIGNAIERGNNNDEIRNTLEYLALEGVQNRSRENGRVTNNFPTVRRQAAKYLGDLGTPEAQASLIKIMRNENEPMVLQEAIKSLGNVDSENADAAVATIVHIVNEFNAKNPDNMLALSAVDALDRIAQKNKGITDGSAFQLLTTIAAGNYIRPVQERAKQVLMNLYKYAASDKKQKEDQQKKQQQQQQQ